MDAVPIPSRWRCAITSFPAPVNEDWEERDVERLGGPPPRRPNLGWATGVKEFNILVALAILCTFLSFRSDVFFTQGNLFGGRANNDHHHRRLRPLGRFGRRPLRHHHGMLLGEEWPLVLAMIAGVLTGSLTGLINGLLITQVGLPPFIATLGTLGIGRGLVYVLTKGCPVTIPRQHDFLLNLGQGYVGPIPIPVINMPAITVIGTIFLSQSTVGRDIYAVGGNEESARLAGINTYVQQIVTGVVILLAVSLDMWQKKRRLRA